MSNRGGSTSSCGSSFGFALQVEIDVVVVVMVDDRRYDHYVLWDIIHNKCHFETLTCGVSIG